MNKGLNLLPKITLYVLLVLCVVVSVMFYVGGSAGSVEVAGDFLDIPKYSDLLLGFSYALVGIALVATLCAVIMDLVRKFKVNPKSAIASIGVVVAFIALFVICWFLGSPDEVKIIGYEGTDNVGFWAQLSDCIMYATYVLFAGTILTLIWGAIYTRVKK